MINKKPQIFKNFKNLKNFKENFKQKFSNMNNSINFNILKILIFFLFFFSAKKISAEKISTKKSGKYKALKFNSKVTGIVPADKIFITFQIETENNKLLKANFLNKKLFNSLKNFYEKNFGIKTGIAHKIIKKIYLKGKKDEFFFKVKTLVLSKASNLKGVYVLLENLKSKYVKQSKIKVYYAFSKKTIKECIDKITINAMRKARKKINEHLKDKEMQLVKIINTSYAVRKLRKLNYGTEEEKRKFSNRKDIRIFDIVLTLEYYAKKIRVEFDEEEFW